MCIRDRSGIALYMLVMLYAPLQDHQPESLWPKPRLSRWEHVGWKFLSLKSVILANFTQELGFGFLAHLGNIQSPDPTHDATTVSHALVRLLFCLEMLPIAVLQWYAFPVDLYTDELRGIHEQRGGEMRALSLKQATYSTFDHSDMASIAADPFQ
eukprot:TRINITY_DN10876_c0_g1_i3.p1 TRINITY_DN10876_c0_g1~~TRINITY_DN10876_c0_g1_i3.p1  ORF type:complete len:155 (+),score=27.38 TRINITY_DN10876_c0_g1_i3:195-659(+)